jgi:PIN domain nuclease of toxin-antitoxin system
LAWWFEQALTLSEVELLAITPEIAMCAVSLEVHHSDPQDRLIIATAIQHQVSLMSVEQKFKLYRELDGLLIQA